MRIIIFFALIVHLINAKALKNSVYDDILSSIIDKLEDSFEKEKRIEELEDDFSYIFKNLKHDDDDNLERTYKILNEVLDNFGYSSDEKSSAGPPSTSRAYHGKRSADEESYEKDINQIFSELVNTLEKDDSQDKNENNKMKRNNEDGPFRSSMYHGKRDLKDNENSVKDVKENTEENNESHTIKKESNMERKYDENDHKENKDIETRSRSSSSRAYHGKRSLDVVHKEESLDTKRAMLGIFHKLNRMLEKKIKNKSKKNDN